MVKIEKGYNNKPTIIRVSKADSSEYLADIEIEQFGLPRILSNGTQRIGGKISELKVGEIWQPSTTTAHYVNLSELLALRDEINVAIKEIAGV